MNITADDISQALHNNEFDVYYQPKFDMETKRATGMEALTRWKRRIGTRACFVSPEIFIPVAEAYGLITHLTLYVVEKVCKCLREWMASSYHVVPIAVNISKRDLCSPLFIRRLLMILQKHSIDCNHIQLEITETALVPDSVEITENIMALRSMGFVIALDDFGTGYASLACLKTLPVDVIKIDRMFLEDILDDPISQSILKSILDLARCLNLDVVYEGIETKEQADYLRKFEFKTAQGFYYTKPLPKGEASFCLREPITLVEAR